MFVFWGFLHGLALVVHRVWNNFGFKMNKFLAWFITFNFINISWIFFRAKDWDSAMKVLGGMVGLNGIVIHPILKNKLVFLSKYGVIFKPYTTIGLPILDILWFIFACTLVLCFKNSIEQLKTFKFNHITALISASAFVISILSLTKISEFLYFNF